MRMCMRNVHLSLPRLPASSLNSEKFVKKEHVYPSRNPAHYAQFIKCPSALCEQPLMVYVVPYALC